MVTVKASSLMEVLVALVITVTVFTAGTLIYMQALSNGAAGRYVQAIELASRISEESFSLPKKNRIIESNNQKAEVSFTGWENSARLLVMEIVIKDANSKIIFSEKHLVSR